MSDTVHFKSQKRNFKKAFLHVSDLKCQLRK